MRIVTRTILAVAILSGLHGCFSAANAGNFYSTTCDFSRRAVNCTTLGGPVDASPRVIEVPASGEPEDVVAARIRKWEAFCQPKPVTDRYGVDRLTYAHPGCEFGRSE
jgi:hypothetical protein